MFLYEYGCIEINVLIEKKKRTRLEGKLADRPGFFIQLQLFLQFLRLTKPPITFTSYIKEGIFTVQKVNGNSSVPVFFFFRKLSVFLDEFMAEKDGTLS